MKKKLLIENEIQDLTDFQKILLLNKRKLSSDDVGFESTNEIDTNRYVEVVDNGLLFHFHDLEEFLKFFFPDTYGENSGGDGEFEAQYYDSMYYGSYDFSSECYDRSYDDWKEGYTLGYLCDPAVRKLKTLIEIVDRPFAEKNFVEKNGKIDMPEQEEVAELLGTYFKGIDDRMDEIICPARHYAVSDAVSDALKETFCDGLRQFGIENWGKSSLTSCFKTYFIPWGSLVQMFVESSDFDGNALDIMFDYIDKHFKGHPPIYYEMEYNYFDNEVYEDRSCDKLVSVIDEYIEEATQNFSPEYVEVLNKITKLKLFNSTRIPGTKDIYIKVNSVDPETLQVKYQVGVGSWFSNNKYGQSTADEVIAMATQPGLFDPTEFRISPSDLKDVGYYKSN